MITTRTAVALALTAAVALLTAGPARAGFVTLTPSADTMITEHSGLGGPNSSHGGDAAVLAVNVRTFLSYPLIRFDLAPLAGQTVLGPATLRLHAYLFFNPTLPRPVGVNQALIGWDPATATFNNFGPTPGVQPGTDIGPALDTQSVVRNGGSGDIFPVSWTIPADVVQGWVDNPGSNNGLLVNNIANFGGSNDITFYTMESATPPTLTFEVAGAAAVPEPASLSLLAAGGIGLLGYARRRAARRTA